MTTKETEMLRKNHALGSAGKSLKNHKSRSEDKREALKGKLLQQESATKMMEMKMKDLGQSEMRIKSKQKSLLWHFWLLSRRHLNF